MSSISTHDSITKMSMAVHEAADAIIKAKLVPEQPTPSVAAMLAANAKDLNVKLRGSLLRIQKAATVEYRVVPAGSDEVLKAGGTKLELMDKWNGAAKATALTAIEADGVDAVVFGVLTIGASAGSAAAGLQAHGLGAKIGPPSGAAGPIAKLSVKVAGSTTDCDVEDAVSMCGLRWQSWYGEEGGIAAAPTGDGVQPLVDARAATIEAAEALGEGSAAAMAARVLELLKLPAGADGKHTVGTLAEVLAGVLEEDAAPMLAAVLAEVGDDTAERKVLLEQKRRLVPTITGMLLSLGTGALDTVAKRLDALHGRSDGGRGAVRLTRCTEVRRRTRAVSDLS